MSPARWTMHLKGRLCNWPLSTMRAMWGYLILALLFYLPVLSGLRSFPDGDFTHHFLPFSMFQHRELLSARLPIWNPHTYSGHPFLADVQAAIFYPVSNIILWLTLAFGEAGARLYILEVEAALHVAMAGFFAYLLVRTLTRHAWAGFLAGIVFAFSGYLTGYPPLQLAVLRSAIWLPFVLWLLLRAFAEPQAIRWWLGSTLALTVALLAGHSQTFLYVAYTTMGWAGMLLVRYLTERRNRPNGAAPWILVVGLLVVVLGVAALSAVQLLPSLEFVALSVRANVEYEFVSGGFPLQDTWQILLPAVLTQFSPLYVGVVGLGLAGIACYSLFTGSDAIGAEDEGQDGQAIFLPERWGILFFAGLAALALLVSYGANGPLYGTFYRFLPGWDLFRGQERVAYLVAFGMSVLAGYGVAKLSAMRYVRRRRYALVYGALVTGGVYAFGMLWQLPGRTALGHGAYLLTAGVTLLLAMAMALLVWMPGWSQIRYVWIGALLTANLFVANMMTNVSDFGPVRKAELAPELEALESAVLADAAASGSAGRVYNEYRAYEDYGMRLEVEDVWGSSPLRLAHYAALFDEFPMDRMWQLTGVDHVLTWRKELFVPSVVLAEFPQAEDTTYLHRLESPNPRAWLAPVIQVVDDEEAFRLLADHSFDLGRTALVAPEYRVSDGAIESGENQVGVSRLAPNRLRVQVESEGGGMVVVSENWMPGWKVEGAVCSGDPLACADAAFLYDGLPDLTPVRVDATLLGIAVPAGFVAFDLVYWPDSIQRGLWISSASVLTMAMMVLVLAQWRRKARKR